MVILNIGYFEFGKKVETGKVFEQPIIVVTVGAKEIVKLYRKHLKIETVFPRRKKRSAPSQREILLHPHQ